MVNVLEILMKFFKEFRKCWIKTIKYNEKKIYHQNKSYAFT